MNKLIEKITDRIRKEIPVYTGKAISIIQEEAKAYNEVKTNADAIRNMTDEELAEFLTGNKNGYDYIKKLGWLKAEREG